MMDRTGRVWDLEEEAEKKEGRREGKEVVERKGIDKS